MLISKYIVMDNMLRLKNILKSSSMNEQKRNCMFQDILREVLISIEENAAYLNSYKLSQAYQQVLDFKQKFMSMDYETLKHEVDQLKEYIDEVMEYHNYDHTYFVHEVRRDNNGTCSLLQKEFDFIANQIDFPNREIKILDPLCINESAIRLGQTVHNKKIYGITQSETYDKEITKHMDALAIGRGSKAKITNNVFDMVVIKSSTTWSIDVAMMRRIFTLKSEKNNFVSNMKYLREGGLAVMIVPYGKITNDMLDAYCRHLEDIRLFRPSNDLKNQCNYTIIIGRRRSLKRKGLDEELYAHLKATYVEYNKIPRINEVLERRYCLPAAGMTLENFRGSIIDEDTVLSALSHTSILNQLLNTKRHEDDVITNVRPPLPFNTGQIGLVLTSGCLDGVVDEGEGYCHVIKGRVIKSSVKTQEEVDDSTYDTIETINNKVEISVMLPNGEYRILA